MRTEDHVADLQLKYGLTKTAAEELVLGALDSARKKAQIREKLAVRRATNYLSFLHSASPEMDWDSQLAFYLSSVVDRVISGELKNVTISLGPRSGKSELVTKRLPVYWLETRPSDKVIVGGYNHTVSRMFTSAGLRIYRDRNPSDLDMEAEDEWGNHAGGSVRAVGVGSGVTGFGGDCLTYESIVKTPEGEVSIGSIYDSGDRPLVLSVDHATGKQVYRPIVTARKKQSNYIIELVTSSQKTLTMTNDHRVYTVNRGYQKAGSLIGGDSLLVYHEDGLSRVEAVLSRKRISWNQAAVYDIQVEETRNFFANDILVHNCILLDDVVKSHAEAFSKSYRDRCWNWYINDLRTRRNNLSKTPTIIIGTRWHRDDIIGRVHQEAEPGEWTDICIPAIAGENDVLGRLPGESINPIRLPISALLREKKLLGPRFDSLYQGKPIDESGVLFDIDKFEYVDEVPIEAHRVRAWDKAATEGGGDWTVGVLMAYDKQGIIYVEDVIRGQWSRDKVREKMKETLISDGEKYNKVRGYRVRTWFEREPAGDGKTAADDIIRMMAPYEIYADRPSDNKTARAAGWAVCQKAGNAKIKRAAWNPEYIDEHARFVPDIDNRQDDQVDGSALSYNKLVIENAIVSVR